MAEAEKILTSEIILVMVGGLLGLIGTALISFFNSKRHSKQLLHDQTMEKQRHELDPRKDVYLPAIESVNTLINYLLTLPTIDQSKDSSSQDLNQFANNFSKIELVGSDETIESIGHVNEELSKHVYPILIKKAQLDLLRSKVKGLEFENRKWKKKYSGFHKQILELYEN